MYQPGITIIAPCHGGWGVFLCRKGCCHFICCGINQECIWKVQHRYVLIKSTKWASDALITIIILLKGGGTGKLLCRCQRWALRANFRVRLETGLEVTSPKYECLSTGSDKAAEPVFQALLSHSHIHSGHHNWTSTSALIHYALPAASCWSSKSQPIPRGLSLPPLFHIDTLRVCDYPTDLWPSANRCVSILLSLYIWPIIYTY